MASTVAEALEWSLRPRQRKVCQVAKFMETLSPEDRQAFVKMNEVLSGHATRKALLTVEGLNPSTIPAASTFKRHNDGECSCPR